jgi:hypothetical protein
MRRLLIAIAAFSMTPAVFAQTAAPAPVKLTSGQVLRDVDMNKLGPISQVNGDGSVQIIYEQRLVTIPAASLSVVDGKAKTSLSRKDLAKL